MRKKALCALLSAAMIVSMFTACGSDDKNDEGGNTTPAATKAAENPEGGDAADPTKAPEDTTPVAAAKLDAPDVSGWDDSKAIHVYSWNDEFGSRLAYIIGSTDAAGNKLGDLPDGYTAPHTELAAYVYYENQDCSGTDGTYQERVNTALTSDKYPSVIAADNDVAKYYTESDDTLALSSIGITNDMYANAYQFTKDYATYNGELKALSWQAASGNFTYRYSIAQKVLGSGEPADVQEYVKDWDTFFKTADTMKENGYKMLSGPDDVKYAIWDQQTQPWVTVDASGSEKLTLDSAVTDYFETAKKLYDGDYTKKTSMWSEDWSANMGDDADVFGYFGCTWFVYWCIAGAKGDWRVCEGPVGYHWGGTYVAVMKDCPNTDLAAFLIYSLCCDEDIMYAIEENTLDFVNNKAAVKRIIDDGKGASDILGGQNPVETWAEAATTIDLSNSCYLDSALKAYMDKASEGYNTGTFATVEDAVQYVKDQVAKDYSYISVE